MREQPKGVRRHARAWRNRKPSHDEAGDSPSERVDGSGACSGGESGEHTRGESVEEPVDTYALPDRWTWFAHTDAHRTTGYEGGLLKLGEFATLNEFFGMFNHVPSPSKVFLGARALTVQAPNDEKAVRVTGYALFRHDVQPAWEDPQNEQGCDVCFRGQWSSDRLEEVWFDLTTALVNEEMPDGVVGLRVTHRTDRRTNTTAHKIELWLRHLDASAVSGFATKRWPSLGAPTVTEHAKDAHHAARPKLPRRRSRCDVAEQQENAKQK